jgi:hypothetical protein
MVSFSLSQNHATVASIYQWNSNVFKLFWLKRNQKIARTMLTVDVGLLSILRMRFYESK